MGPECVATYSSRLGWQGFLYGSSRALQSCSAVGVYLVYRYLGLGVLRPVFGVRYAVYLLVIK